MSQDFRPLPPTFVNSTNLDNVFPDMRIVEKFHRPSEKYPDPSYEVIAALKGQQGKIAKLNPKKSI